MKKLLASLSLIFAVNATYAQISVKVNVERIDTSKQTVVDLNSVEMSIGNRNVDSSGMEYVNVTSYAVDSMSNGDFAIIVRHHKIPASVYDNAWDGFDPVTGKPNIKKSVLLGLLFPYNLKIKE